MVWVFPGHHFPPVCCQVREEEAPVYISWKALLMSPGQYVYLGPRVNVYIYTLSQALEWLLLGCLARQIRDIEGDIWPDPCHSMPQFCRALCSLPINQRGPQVLWWWPVTVVGGLWLAVMACAHIKRASSPREVSQDTRSFVFSP